MAAEGVRLLQTHVSWLFFTGCHVYKVKKPVDLGFLDFTTLDARRHFCEEELRLNRRVSPDVYLAVSELRESDGRYAFGGEGEVVEYAVKMRQLPADRWLSTLLEAGSVTPRTVRRIAGRIADFHRAAASDAEITRLGGIESVRINTAENFEQTREFIGLTLDRATYDVARAATEAFLERRGQLFARREAEGRVRDCHGDLHAAQICVENGIAIIDCIEFNYRFRFSDVAADLAFLAMDLDHFDHPDLSGMLVDEYIEHSGDTELPKLLPFFKAYRAFTRGKVESIRVAQLEEGDPARGTAREEADRYFKLAAAYARIRRPLLIITAGLMGTGKSTLATALAERLGAEIFSSDVVRKQLADISPEERRLEAWEEGIYSPEFTGRVYRALHDRGDAALRSGRHVVLDASYAERGRRAEAAAVARECDAELLVVEVIAPTEVVRRRLRERDTRSGGVSDGRIELLHAQQSHFQPVDEVPDAHHIVVETTGSPGDTAFIALKQVYLAREARRRA